VSQAAVFLYLRLTILFVFQLAFAIKASVLAAHCVALANVSAVLVLAQPRRLVLLPITNVLLQRAHHGVEITWILLELFIRIAWIAIIPFQVVTV